MTKAELLRRHIEDRAGVMALVVLKRRGDLATDPPPAGVGTDIEVTRHRGGDRPAAAFGVVVGGDAKPAGPDLARRVGRAFAGRPGGRPLRPVCGFFFAMGDDTAYFTWLAEPIVSADGEPRLARPVRLAVEPLDAATLDAIVERVEAWYDALVHALSA